MNNSKEEKSEKVIIQDLKDVHQKAKASTDIKNDGHEQKPASTNIDEQIKGSDADSDKMMGNQAGITEKMQQSKGSDADKNK